LTQKELAEKKLEISKSLILTFRDLRDLKELREWCNREWQENLDLYKYVDRMRMYSLEIGKPELWEEWKKDNEKALLSFKSLNELKDKMRIKICQGCGIAFSSVQKNRMYCNNNCKQRVYDRKKRTIAKGLTK